MTLADILNLVHSYARGAAGGAGDLLDNTFSAIDPRMSSNMGAAARDFVGSGNPNAIGANAAETAGEWLGIPMPAIKGASLAAIMGAAPKKLGKRAAQAAENAARQEALDLAASKTAAVRAEPMLQVPDSPEFWPWRVQHGGFEAAQNKDKSWFTQKRQSPEEARLAGAISEAEDHFAKNPDQNVEVWPFNEMKRPILQGNRLDYAKSVKGTPDWIASQYGPEWQQKMKDMALGATDNPDAWKFYWTGQWQDDMHKMFGPEAGQ